MLDDFRIYERALSKEEVETIFSGDLKRKLHWVGKILKSVSSLEMKIWRNYRSQCFLLFAPDQEMNLGEIELGTLSFN